MNRYFKIYLHYAKTSFQLFAAHRFNFTMSAVANILWTTSQLITLKYLFIKIPSFQDWQFADLVLLLGFGQIFVYASYTIFDVNLNRLFDKLINGNFDRMLTKPLNIRFQASFEELNVSTLLPMASTVVPLIIYGLANQHNLTPWAVVAAFLTIFLGVIILFFLSLSLSGLSFFIEDVQALKEFLVMRSNDLARIPLSVFPRYIQLAMTFIIPIAFVSYYPTLIIRGQAQVIHVIPLELLLIVIFWQISRLVWNSGLKRYSGIG